MPKKRKTDSKEAESGFEDAMNQLESIVRRLETGGGALEEALEDYEQAIALLKQCHGQLSRAERKIEILSGVDAEGNPVVEEVEDENELPSNQDKQPRKSANVTAKKKPARKNESSHGEGLF